MFNFGPMPPQKAKNFKQSARRLVAQLAPERAGLIGVLALAVSSVALGVLIPWLLGQATNVIYRGWFGTPAGEAVRSAAIAAAEAAGNASQVDMLRQQVVPGHGIDFGDLAGWLELALLVAAGSSLFTWLQGYVLNHLVQRTVRRMRGDVQAKLARLPLSYFDRQPHGEILSRVTNDIDNVAMGLQQTHELGSSTQPAPFTAADGTAIADRVHHSSLTTLANEQVGATKPHRSAGVEIGRPNRRDLGIPRQHSLIELVELLGRLWRERVTMRHFYAVEIGQRLLVISVVPVHRMRGDRQTALRVHIGNRAASRLIPINGPLDADANEMEIPSGDLLADEDYRPG